MKREQIDLCRKGDPRAVLAFVDEYRSLVGPLVFAAEAHAPAGDGRDATVPFRMFELSAEAFGALLTQMNEAPGGPPFTPWARRVIYQALRQRGRHPAYPLPDHDGTPQAPVSEAVDPDKLRAGIARLLPELRFALWALCTERMTLPAAADVLNTTPDRLQDLLEMALGELRQFIRDEGLAGATQSVAEEARLIPLIYGSPTDAERRAVEGSTTRFANVQRGLDDLIRERHAIGRAMALELPTSRILREVRLRHRLRKGGIPPVTWVAAQILLGVGLVISLLAIGRHVPIPSVTIEPVVGEVSLVPPPRSAVGETLISAENYVEQTTLPDGQRKIPMLRPGETLRTAAWSSARLRVGGSNPIELGPDTEFGMKAPSLTTPVHVVLQRGVALFDMRGVETPVQIDTPLASFRFLRGHGLLDVGDGSVRIAMLDGVATWEDVEPEGATNEASDGNAAADDTIVRRLRGGQGGRLWLTDDGRVAGPAPLAEFAPSGYPRAHFPDEAAQKLAIANDYVLRLMESGDALKCRFHWQNLRSYPLALDAVTPAVQSLLDNFVADVERLSQRRRELQREVELATIRVNDVRRAMSTTQQDIDNLQMELADIDSRREGLDALRDEAADLAAQIGAKTSPEAPDAALHDPDGSKVAALQAQIEEVSQKLRALRDVEIQRIAAAAVLEQMQPQLQEAIHAQQAAKTAVANVNAEIEAVVVRLAELDKLNADLAAANNDLADARAAAKATTDRLAAAREAVIKAQADVAAQQTAVAAARKLVADAQAATDEHEAANAALEAARAAAAQADQALKAATERASKATASATAARQKNTEAQAALKAAADKLTAAETRHKSASDQLNKLAATVRETADAFNAATAALEQQQAATDTATRQRDAARTALENATTARRSAESTLKAANEKLATATALLQTRRDELAAATASRVEAAARQRELHAAQLAAQQRSDAAAHVEAERKAEYDAALAVVKKAEAEAIALSKEREAAQAAVASATTDRDAAKRAADAAAALQTAAEEKLTAARNSSKAAREYLDTATAAQKTARAEWDAAQAAVEKARTTEANAATALTTATAAEQQATTALATATARAATAAEAESAANAAVEAATIATATANQKLDAVSQIIATLAAEIQAIEAERAQLQVQRGELETQLNSDTVSEEEKQQIASQIAEIDTQIGQLDARHREKTTSHQAATLQKTSAEQKLATAEAAQREATARATAAHTAAVAAATDAATAAATLKSAQEARANASSANAAAQQARAAADATLEDKKFQHVAADANLARANGSVVATANAELAAKDALDDATRQAAAANAALQTVQSALDAANAVFTASRNAERQAQRAMGPLSVTVNDALKAHKDAAAIAKTASAAATLATQEQSAAAQKLTAIDSTIERLNAQMPNLQQSVESSTRQQADAQSRATSASEAVTAQTAALAEREQALTAAQKRLGELQRALSDAGAARDAANAELARAKEMFGPAADALESAREDRDAAASGANAADEANAAASAASTEATSALDAARAAQAAAAARAEQAAAAAANAEGKHEAATAAAANANLPAAEATLRDAQNSLTGQQATVARLESALVKLDGDTTRLAARVANLQQRIGTRPAVQAELDAARARLTTAEQVAAAADSRVAELQAKVAPRRDQLAELDKQLVARPKLTMERDQAGIAVNDIRRFMRSIESLQSKLQTANYKIESLERVAGAEVRAERAARMADLRNTLGVQQEIEATHQASQEAAAGELADYHRSVYAARLTDLQNRAVQQLLVLVAGYRNSPGITLDRANKLLRKAIELYPRYRELSGDRRSLALAASVQQDWLTFARGYTAGLPRETGDRWERLTADDLLLPGQGLGN